MLWEELEWIISTTVSVRHIRSYQICEHWVPPLWAIYHSYISHLSSKWKGLLMFYFFLCDINVFYVWFWNIICLGNTIFPEKVIFFLNCLSDSTAFNQIKSLFQKFKRCEFALLVHSQHDIRHIVDISVSNKNKSSSLGHNSEFKNWPSFSWIWIGHNTSWTGIWIAISGGRMTIHIMKVNLLIFKGFKMVWHLQY